MVARRCEGPTSHEFARSYSEEHQHASTDNAEEERDIPGRGVALAEDPLTTVPRVPDHYESKAREGDANDSDAAGEREDEQD